MLYINNLAFNTVLNAKIEEFKKEIPNITNLVTTVGLITFENKIPNVSDLGKKLTITQKLMKLKKKADHDRSNKHITVPEFNKIAAENLDARLKQANLASKSYVANFVKKILIKNLKV